MVDTPATLARMLRELAPHPVIAIDSESNSLYVYQERVCLIQLSTPEADYIVDTLSLHDLAALGEVCADPNTEKVFHGADYDVGTLRRDFGFEFSHIFDTMIASRVLGVKRYSLANLLEERFGVVLNKKMQKYDWGRRPLEQEALEYARLDTHYLLPLREQLLTELRSRRREREARESFDRVAQSVWNRKPFEPDDFWKVKGANKLDSEELGILKALFVMREERARRQDRPPFKVLSNRVMIDLSQRRPEHGSELLDISGLSQRQVRRMGKEILNAVRTGRADPQSRSQRPSQGRRPDDALVERYEQLREWRKACAEHRRVEPDVIISNNLLWEIARLEPGDMRALQAIEGIGDHQIDAYGSDLLSALRG